jgi:hypothetical protein
VQIYAEHAIKRSANKIILLVRSADGKILLECVLAML